MKKKITDFPRPGCSCCLEPATHEVSLNARPLKLERDAGVRSQPYWTGDYRNTTMVSVLLCGNCFKTRVGIDFSVTASLEKVTKE
jgi:hypothetical protein